MKPGPDRPSVDPPSAEPASRAEPSLVQPSAVPRELPRRTPTGTMRSAAANARLASVLEMIGDAFVAFDADFNYTYVNEKAAALFGRKAAELIGRNYWQEFPEVRGTYFADAYVRALETGVPIQFEDHFERWDRWFENRVYPSADGLAIFYTEITDRKRAEEAIVASEARLALIFDTVGDVVFLLTVETEGCFRFASINAAFTKVTGLRAEQVIGKRVEDVLPPSAHELVVSHYREAIDTRATVRWEEVSSYPTGTLYGEVAITPAFDESGACTHLIGSVHDVTATRRAAEQVGKLNIELERRVAERTARLQAANKELEAFSYSVSHDLRAPLRAIGGFAEIIARRHVASLPPEAQRYFANILQASERMNQLIDALLAYSRLGHWAVRRETIALHDVFASLQADFTPRVQQAGGRLAVAADLPAVCGDRVLLEQLFGNLLDNALTYHQPGTPPDVAVDWSREGDDVVVRVRDRGIGIPREHQEKIFDIFQRLHSEDTYPGTGVGLATVRKAADLLGGAVMVESEPGAGATFHVALPAADAAAAAASPEPLRSAAR